MNHSRIEQQITTLTPPPDEPSTPHFDDSAVATAHQVEPLPRRGGIRSESSRRAMTIAAAVIVGMLLGISAVIFSSGTRTDSATLSITEQASAEMDSLDAPAATAVAEITEPTIKREKSRPRMPQTHARRAAGRYMAEEFGDNDDYSSRRSARRVGVIYYGRSRGEQY